SPTKRCRHTFRRGLDPPHKTQLPCSSAELDPHRAPQTYGDGIQTVLSVTASLTRRHTPAAAGRSVPQGPRTACGSRRPAAVVRPPLGGGRPPAPRLCLRLRLSASRKRA